MSRKESEAVPVGNSPVPQHEEFGSDQPTLKEVCRMIKEVFEEGDRRIYKMQEYTGERRSMNQRLTRLEQDARHPRFAMKAERPANTKTRKRTEGAAKALQAKHEDSCTAQRVQKGPKILTCFGVITKPPALPCRDDVVVENGAAAPKPCLPSLEVHSPTAAGGSLSTDENSMATKITFNQPSLRLYRTEEANLKTLLNPSRTTVLSCLLPPPARGLSR